MKKLQFAFAASFLVATMSFAQSTTPGPGQYQRFGKGAGHEKHMPFAKLNLTDVQKQQLKQTTNDFRQQMKTLNKNENITVKEQREQRASIIKTHKNAMMNILTQDQKNQLASMRTKRIEKHSEMSDKRLNKMKMQLGLSDDQVAKIKANQSATQAKMKAMLDNKSEDQSSKKEQFMAMRKEMKENIGSVLTADQKAKMKSIRQEHKGQHGKKLMHDDQNVPQNNVN